MGVGRKAQLLHSPERTFNKIPALSLQIAAPMAVRRCASSSRGVIASQCRSFTVVVAPRTRIFAQAHATSSSSAAANASSRSLSTATTTSATAAVSSTAGADVGGISRIVNPSTSVLFVCDLQKAFASKIQRWNSVLHTTNQLVGTARVLGIPVIVTEQYPRGLGRTDPSVLEALGLPVDGTTQGGDAKDAGSSSNVRLFEKTQFSMLTPEVVQHLESLPGPALDILLTGIESHVCVLQTARDLMMWSKQREEKHGEAPRRVFLVTDALSSQRDSNRSAALTRLRDMGCVSTSSESIAFELMGDAKHPRFKEVSKLYIKPPPQD